MAPSTTGTTRNSSRSMPMLAAIHCSKSPCWLAISGIVLPVFRMTHLRFMGERMMQVLVLCQSVLVVGLCGVLRADTVSRHR